MKFSKFYTRTLPPDDSPSFDETLISSSEIFYQYEIANDGDYKSMKIQWSIILFGQDGKELSKYKSETKFQYTELGKIDNDFTELKRFLLYSVLDIRQYHLLLYSSILFPEINLEKLTCEIMEEIIFKE